MFVDFLLSFSETVYRRGARRWKKFYHVNGHRFQAKRLNRRIQCFYCNDYIWGLGRQGYRCADCKLCVHKKCHRFVRQPCGDVSLLFQTVFVAVLFFG